MFYATTCVGLRYGPPQDMLSGFSWEHGYHRCPIVRGLSVLSRFTRGRVLDCAPCSYAVQRAIPSARGCVTSPSPHRSCAGCRNLDRLSIGCALRLPLRPRLNLIRLALIRNPWSFGVAVSRRHCRYLYLHLLFRYLQQGSRLAFCGLRNAPLPILHQAGFHGCGSGLMPDYYPCGITRLVSCYALFK